MRYVSWLSVLSFLSAFGAVALGSGTASAVPCCSAPMCQRLEPPSICGVCNMHCASDGSDDDEFVSAAAPEGGAVYDEVVGLCRAD